MDFHSLFWLKCFLRKQLLGVWDCQGSLLGSGGDGVHSWTSRAIMTRSGSNGTSPAPRNPPWILLEVIAELKAHLKHGRNSSFVMWVGWQMGLHIGI
jgi:hypothetical protein